MSVQLSIEKRDGIEHHRSIFRLTPIGAAHRLKLDLGKHHKTLLAQLILHTYAYVITRHPSYATQKLFQQKLRELDIPDGCDFSVTWEEARALYCLVTGDEDLAQADEFLEAFKTGIFLFLAAEPTT